MIPKRWDLEDIAGVILFDGDCAFCRNVVGLLLRQLPAVKLQVCSTRSPVGDSTARALGGDPADTFALVTGTGVYIGADAYLRILALGPGYPSWLGRLIAVAPAAVRNGAYYWVANHRPLMSKLMGRGSSTAIPLDRFVPGGL